MKLHSLKTEIWFWGSASTYRVCVGLRFMVSALTFTGFFCFCSEARGADGQRLLLLTAFSVYQTRRTSMRNSAGPCPDVFHWPGFRRRWSGPGCGAWPRSEVEILVAPVHGALLPPLPAVAATNRGKKKDTNYKMFSQTNQCLLVVSQPVKQFYRFKAQHLKNNKWYHHLNTPTTRQTY